MDVVTSISIDGDVGGDGHAFLEDGRPEIKVLGKVGNVDANLTQLRTEWGTSGGHLSRDVTAKHTLMRDRFGLPRSTQAYVNILLP